MALFRQFCPLEKANSSRKTNVYSLGVLPVEKTRVTILPASMSNSRRLFRIQVRFSFALLVLPRRFTDFFHHEA